MSITMHVDDEPTPGLDPDGRPDPAYARALGLVPAPVGRRSAAFALDAAVWSVLAVPGLVGAFLLLPAIPVAGSAPDAATLVLPLVLIGVSQLLLTVFGVVQLVLHGRRGRTLGKAALGIRSVQVATFAAPGFWRVVLRVLVLWAGQCLVPVVGPAVLFASSAWDRERRGRSWLDRVGRCYAVDVRRGLDPFDTKALRHARRVADAPSATAASLPSLASDRGLGEQTFIPSARFSAGVVATADAAAWAPPPIASAPTVDAGRPAASVTLRFDDGSRYTATGPGLFGRGPAPADGDPPSIDLLPLHDETMGVSKTHAAIDVVDGELWVVDRWSRNGTALVVHGAAERPLEPGVRTRVPEGGRVLLGGRWFEVVPEGSTAR